MTETTLNFQDWVIIGSVFGLVLSVWMVAILIWSLRSSKRKEAVEHRLGLGSGHGPSRTLHLWRENEDVTTVVEDNTIHLTFAERYVRAIEQTGWKSTPRAITMMLANVCLGGAFIAFMFTGNILAVAGAIAVPPMFFWILLGQAIAKQGVLAERQLIDAMQLIARSLRAGHPLYGSFQLVSEELKPPMSTVFHDICQEQSLGLGLDQALRRVAERSNMMDLKLFSTSVAIQLKSGGNLADMMERLSFVIRERIRLAKRVRTLTTEVQTSKRLLLCLPFIMFALLNIANPVYMKPLYETSLGNMMLVGALISMACGNWLMNKMGTLKY